MADPLQAGADASEGGRGPTSEGSGTGNSNPPRADGPPIPRDPLRARPRPRVLLPTDIDRHEQEILEAFKGGDPEQAWGTIQAFIREVRHFANESARDRFRQNLGTPICSSCDGLKAGPEVVATCFQLGQCFYTNRKSSDATSAQQSLIDRLTK